MYGGGGKALLARASLFGGAIFCGEGGARPPWPPPGSAHVVGVVNVLSVVGKTTGLTSAPREVGFRETLYHQVEPRQLPGG